MVSLAASSPPPVSCDDLDRSRNFALGGEVDSPDQLEQDWCVDARAGCVDQWAADGNESTYWDEEDNQSQYHLRIRRKKEEEEVNISGVSISGYEQHKFAPRSFQLVCDEALVADVADARYRNNVFETCFPPVPCRVLDLIIFQSYGSSPAVREIKLLAKSQSSARSTHGKLLLPASAQSSTCAHLAGQLLLCLGKGNQEVCQGDRIAHWNCIKGEADASKQGLNGHRSLNRLKEYRWSSGEEKRRTDKSVRYGYLLYNPFDIYFAVAIELYGEWSEKEVEVRHGRAVGPTGRVIGFEPQRVVYQMASANVALNGLWNVVLYNAGAGNSSDAMPVMPIASYHPNALRNFGSVRVGMVPDEEETSIEHVRIMSIDELQLPACDFIKIDAEGFETQVIQGGWTTISAFLPTIYFEDNELNGRIGCSATTQRLKTELGYDCYHHAAPYFNSDNWHKERIDYFFVGGEPTLSYMILCVHASRILAPPQLVQLPCT
ncbi:hypothetical protein GUITHDRAFT_101238 [Guillardia theta CCMP2712]|uniref:Methyltransferase FkbM domain-containing protein n=1 Tax=Guillardia theta (strain CCMP2712) TaxID=905079 RepID=L1JWV0_GUITC|nr:hypothetical protein GUITHDRAFT_101238 [Guillardia theta CCMP2712]EKX52789.1 hypothetical protein GUITHDRAFT_101238 [Guillardia theta CCMP2712]|eukprot:XP_005839769.1 hypothetical protein GUITHDRAFT_101238 [Guillardia theta CCMP2712]